MFKFLHAADVHLDSPLKGLERYPGAPVDAIRSASRRALGNLVDVALREQVAFVLIAGDLYDGDWPDYGTGREFIRQVLRLRDAEIPVMLIAGNHDAANRMTRDLRLPDNVTFFPHEAPGTRILEEHGVAIHGQSFATQSITHDLSKGYPDPIPGMINIGMLHTSATGREGHENYAPCTVEGLRSHEYDYWALGHVHAYETLSSEPGIIFSGTIQGRHVRETGPKGCLLCNVNEHRQIDPRFQALDVFRWETAVVDLTTVESIDDAMSRILLGLRQCQERSDGRALGTRVQLTGVTPLHRELSAQRSRWTNEVYTLAMEAGSDVWIEKVCLATRAPRLRQEEQSSTDDPVGELTDILNSLRAEPGALEACGISLEDVWQRIPAGVRPQINLDDSDWWRSVVDEAEARLASQLLGKKTL